MIETDRLILRQWNEQDKQPFYELNSNSKVMEFFPSILSKEESDSFVDKTIKLIGKNSWGLFAVEEKTSDQFIGFIGLSVPSYKTHFSPFTEIGWRLGDKFWKRGYATEGAKAVLNFAFESLKLNEVVSFTSKLNLPSITVMERIGMTRDLSGDFNHPNVEEGDRLRLHVLYRIKNRSIIQDL